MHTTAPRGGPTPDDGDGAPPAPAIPSFASLRGGARRSPADLLVPGPSTDAPTVPTVPPAPTARAGTAGHRPTARPAEYGDLLLLGARLLRGAAALPGRVARRSVLGPARCLRRLLGERA